MSQPRQRQLFVIGFFRSGTSLLYSFLNLHSQIKLMYEADLLGNPLVSVASSTGIKWWERLDFFNSCLRRHKLKPQPDWSKVQSAGHAAQLLYEQYAGTERLYVGEKSPSYYNCMPLLAEQFPDARFIVIWRDPRAVVNSIRRAGEKIHFFRNRSLPLRSVIGFEQMQKHTLELRAKGIPIVDYCYEELVEKPEVILRAICTFLELPFEPGMLELDKADVSMFPPGEHHSKAKSGELKRDTNASLIPAGPISKKMAGYFARWKTHFQNRLATRRYWQETDASPTGPVEGIIDQTDCYLRCLYSEQVIPAVYGLLPLGWLSAYRRMRKPLLLAGGTQSGTQRTKISVVTPSYKQLPWLKLCIASVADQQGVEVEHIVQDAQSGPELAEWVGAQPSVKLFVEADSGMYDAINRGFARATGDIICWLNSDEQYLEGTLAKVARFFEEHPEVDALFGDALLIGNTGTLLSYRKTIFPSADHVQLSHLNTLSCATFVRRSVVTQGYNLDTRWRAIADAAWVVALLKGGISMAVLNVPMAVFTITDKNLGQSSLALTEMDIWQSEMPAYLRAFRYGFILIHRLKKLFQGAYWPRTIKAHFYTLGSPTKRVSVAAPFIGFKWPSKV